MKVKELKEILSKVNNDMEIKFEDGCQNFSFFIYETAFDEDTFYLIGDEE